MCSSVTWLNVRMSKINILRDMRFSVVSLFIVAHISLTLCHCHSWFVSCYPHPSPYTLSPLPFSLMYMSPWPCPAAIYLSGIHPLHLIFVTFTLQSDAYFSLTLSCYHSPLWYPCLLHLFPCDLHTSVCVSLNSLHWPLHFRLISTSPSCFDNLHSNVGIKD